MGYFSAQLRPRPLERPHAVRLWEEPAGWRITWGEPPPAVCFVQLTRDVGGRPAESITVPAQPRWWLLGEAGVSRVGVAWVRGTEIGPATSVMVPHPHVRSAGPLGPSANHAHGPLVAAKDYLHAVDAALEENQAKVGLFGLFDV
jgi:hypothetical protein